MSAWCASKTHFQIGGEYNSMIIINCKYNKFMTFWQETSPIHRGGGMKFATQISPLLNFLLWAIDIVTPSRDSNLGPNAFYCLNYWHNFENK